MPKATAAAAPTADRRGCWPKTSYSPAQVTTILDLRARGESLKAVARRVGGSRQDVRAVERQQRKRPWPRAGVRDPSPPICPTSTPAPTPAPAPATAAGSAPTARRTGP